MNYRDKAKQLHENVNHTYDGYNYVLHLDAVEAVHQNKFVVVGNMMEVLGLQ